MFKVPVDAVSIIKESLRGSFANTVTFPEHIKKIATVGVIRYQVDLKHHKVTYHLANGTTHIENIELLNNQINTLFFAKKDVKAAVNEIQKQKIDYPTFLNRIASAGTKSYEVNINEGKVVYQGEEESHIEEFPKLVKA